MRLMETSDKREPVIHVLKTWPEPYAALTANVRGEHAKTHEVRRSDRDYRVGDVLELCEFFPERDAYSGRRWWMEITYITQGGTFGLPPDLCVMSVKDAAESKVRAIWRATEPRLIAPDVTRTADPIPRPEPDQSGSRS